ncbi:uncharacterized protein ACO6RY_01933 [Pungitius sinensis]
MKLDGPLVLLLIGCVCLQRVDCSLPDFTQVESDVVTSLKKKNNGLSRLPGLCQRLKRRRITVLCHRETFCWRGQSRSGHVCLCPRGSSCSHVFVHTL